MDQDSPPETLTSLATKKLNAEAPEFVPRSSASPSPVLPHVYAAAPRAFVPPLRPPPYYVYDGFVQPNAVPFYVNQLSPVESASDRRNGSAGADVAPKKDVLSEAHVKILSQVEFYFSDINLATTDQLFGFMSKDPEGYVPLSVVASFKKIKTATSGITQLANILRSSKKLLVSEDGEKVKRQHPLTESDMEKLQSRIVIAENLPEDHSHQNLMKIFSSVGSVKSIRTCPPQKSNGGASSTSKAGKGDAMHLSSKFYAFVEYDSVEVAEKAVIELKDEDSWRHGLKVRLLLKSAVKPTQTRLKKAGHEGQSIGSKDEAVIPEKQQHNDSDSQFHERQLEDLGNHQRKGRNYVKGKGKGQGRGRTNYAINGGGILGNSSSTEISAKTSAVPRMPDGTKGFSMGRGKPMALILA
ncbi:hypothetical protein ACJIZ3_017230 [Penstemon smallii]|uniref:La-related protein 6B n=1 Tax=Penstemon smallii TaxID=265156 RepID=A0ABD3SVB9_9LAMI